MQTIILIGAGQMGQAALRLINRSSFCVEAFADNNTALHGKTLCGKPILSVEAAVARQPDVVLIAVVGADRTAQLKEQLFRLGYRGQIRTLAEYSRALDIRGAVFDLLTERVEKLTGDLAELGVYQGDFAAQINRRFPDRKLYLFDTFEGFDSRDILVENRNEHSRAAVGDFSDTSVELMLSKMSAPEQVVVRKGYFPNTADGVNAEFAFVSLDADLYEPTFNGLKWFYPRMVSGGIILLHDYRNARFSGVFAAVEDYEKAFGPLLLLPVGDLHGSAMIIHP